MPRRSPPRKPPLGRPPRELSHALGRLQRLSAPAALLRAHLKLTMAVFGARYGAAILCPAEEKEAWRVVGFQAPATQRRAWRAELSLTPAALRKTLRGLQRVSPNTYLALLPAGRLPPSERLRLRLYGEVAEAPLGFTVVLLPRAPRQKQAALQERLRELEVIDQFAQLALQNARLLEEAKREIEEGQALHQTTSALASALDRQPLLERIVEAARTLTGAEGGTIYEFEPETMELRATVSLDPYAKEMLAAPPLKVGEGLTGQVALTRRGEIVNDSTTDPRPQTVPGTPDIPEALLSVPLIARENLLGVITLSRMDGGRFSKRDLRLLTAFAHQASVAIENARLFQETLEAKRRSEVYLDLLTHDVANLVTPLHVYLSALRSEGHVRPEGQAFFSKAEAAVAAVGSLVGRVRRFSLLQQREAVALQPVEAVGAFHRAVRKVTEQLHGRALVADVRGPPALHVLADEMLEDVFLNLCQNAAKYDERPQVNLEVAIEETTVDGRPWVRIALDDHGRGIPPNRRDQVFSRFTPRGEAASSGFGLGLSIVRALVQRYRGRIWVEDRIPGDHTQGSRFVLLLQPGPPAEHAGENSD